jgi:nucleotide-binding universal stress UspA family protein
MYKDILLPTDGSEEAEAAINHAKELAEKFGSKIHIIHVVDITQGVGDPAFQSRLDEMKEFGEETAEEAAEQLGDIDVETHVTVGLPHQEIDEYVEENGIDMVVMGSHGRSGLNRFLLGSVTEKVLRTTSAPVLTVKREED